MTRRQQSPTRIGLDGFLIVLYLVLGVAWCVYAATEEAAQRAQAACVSAHR